tara:strand:+ start:3744 stop:4235 length:492 start_codon:yes stop_codon:yes gene_type:complete
MSSLSDTEKLQLKKMVSEMGSSDNSEQIRKLKHSSLIRDDVRKIDSLKYTYDMIKNKDKFRDQCITECSFLYTKYPDIFNGVVNNEMDLTILTKFVTILKLIEENKIDQEEGSVMVGKLLKELYIDSALKRADNIDEQNKDSMPVVNKGKQLTWKEYKIINNK